MATALKTSTMKLGIVTLLVVSVLMGGTYLYATWQNPPGTSRPESAPVLIEGSSTPSVVEVKPSETPAPLDTPTPTPNPTSTYTPTIEPVCGASPSMTILISGVASEGYRYGLADAVRVVRVDFQRKTVSILALPRDMWVRIPSISNHGVKEGKLNQAYFYGTEGMGYYDGSGYGSGLLALTLQENFGLHVDHYVAVNLYAFRDIVDAMGGVDVYLPSPVYVKRFGEPKLYKKAGYRHLSGKEAEKVVRARIGIGDFGRIENQTVVLKAVAAKMISPSSFKHLPGIVTSLIRETQTDLSPSDISKLICLAEKVDPNEDFSYHMIPRKLLSEAWVRDHHLRYMAYVLTYEPHKIKRIIEDFQNGNFGG